MIDSRPVLIPGGMRLRSAHPIDRNGRCEFLLDLERNTLLEVPDLFQYYAAVALETGELDEDLVGWLASEDLLTYEPRSAPPPVYRSSFAEMPGFFAGTGAAGGLLVVDDRAHYHVFPGTEREVLGSLEALFTSLGGNARLTFHLESAAGGIDLEALRGLVGEVRRFGGEADYELQMAPEEVSRAAAALLEENPFLVRVRCDGPQDPRWGRERGVRDSLGLLQRHLGARLTVHSVVRHPPLSHLWGWARDLGLERLHVTRLDPFTSDHVAREGELRRFRADLDEVCNDMFAALSGSLDRPLLYEPVTRVVARMSRSGSERRRSPHLAVFSQGRMLPLSRPATVPGGSAPGARPEVGEAPCNRCWARLLCGHGACAAPSLAGVERVGPRGRHCDFWRAEVEAGALFHRRLHEADPGGLLGLKGPVNAASVDPLQAVESFTDWPTC